MNNKFLIAILLTSCLAYGFDYKQNLMNIIRSGTRTVDENIEKR